jgi:CBS domain-containing membrane protein
MRDLRVRELIEGGVRTVGRNDKVSDADALMERHRIRHLPVLDEDGSLAGILSRRDVSRTTLQRGFGYGEVAREKIFARLLVKEVMTNRVETVAPDALAADAARRMMELKIGCLVVVEGDRIVGILTETDFVRQVARTGGPRRE